MTSWQIKTKQNIQNYKYNQRRMQDDKHVYALKESSKHLLNVTNKPAR